ncbi:aspartyl-phosphate phosphatase Spo0E family protein [Shimazuella kribbensis]|uniref:aspartyl-phosphate phosphatase Spo0E family protein n=1 Tax=Shimazuella kribbensis TaxID=139808 RepID=UPI0004097D25|nr:aspartyl-phosphate phosphatase Spo0E family protein [Shimazuella kribbensis]
MEDVRPLKRLEKELERVRKKLHQSVRGEPSRLLDPTVLPISRELDLLIVQYQYLKHNI